VRKELSSEGAAACKREDVTMMTKTIEMPEVAGCEAAECAYNHDLLCRARAITVGDGTQPMCDTAFNNGRHTRGERIAGVGACKVANCRHNSDLECQADMIQVILSRSLPMCGTYAE
jgi:hypothetical protein